MCRVVAFLSKGGLSRTMEGICHKCGEEVQEVVTCKRCGKLFCEMDCASVEDVKIAFDTFYSCPHCGHMCPQCRGQRDAEVSARYCRECFAGILWGLYHQFEEAGRDLYWVFYDYCIKAP
jgi:hypothetical protein